VERAAGEGSRQVNSRERILAAITHRPVDRVPIDFGGTRQSGISVWAYQRLRSHLGLTGLKPPRIFDLYQMLAEVEQEVGDRFGSDCVGLNRPAVAFGIRNERWRRFAFPGGLEAEVPGGFVPEQDAEGGMFLRRGTEVVAAMPAGGFYFDRLEKYPGALHPDLKSWRAPRLDDPSLEHFHRASEVLYSQTDKAVIAALGPPYELFYGLGQGGFEDWMVTFASEPEYVAALYEELTQAWLENLRRFHEAVGGRVQILQICDDFGTQSAPFLSERMFREKLLPYYKRGLDWIHRNTAWKVMLHSDGAIFPLLPLILEMGVDILNPVQVSAAGMRPERLKREFGSRLVFWGGSCDAQGAFAHGTPEQVAGETRRNLAALTPGSGYVCAPIHNIQANVPPENIVALFDTARAFDVGFHPV
jgi:uroporphyrinogen decarboxylase